MRLPMLMALALRASLAQGQVAEQLDERFRALDRQVRESKDAGTMSPQQLEAYKADFKKLFLQLGDIERADGLARLRVGHFPRTRGRRRDPRAQELEPDDKEKPPQQAYRVSCWSCEDAPAPRKSAFEGMIRRLDARRAASRDPEFVQLLERVIIGAQQASALESLLATKARSQGRTREMDAWMASLAHELQTLVDLLLRPRERSGAGLNQR